MNYLYFPLFGSTCLGLSPVHHQEHHHINCITHWYVRAGESSCCVDVHPHNLLIFPICNTNWVWLKEDPLCTIPQWSNVRGAPPHKVPDLRMEEVPHYVISELSSLLYIFVASCLEYVKRA
jgi:hypothetical protein